MSEVPKDLAEKVLGAELRNVVKKVGDGGTLTSSEHERMQRAAIETLQPEDLQEARVAALLRRFALGQDLSKEQRREISGFLPAGKPIARRITSENYRYKLAHYVPVLGIDKDEDGRIAKDPERKLKRWIARGRENNPPDLPPFDEPHLMAEWWRRNMKWGVPLKIALLEQQQGDQQEAPPPQPGPVGDATTPDKPKAGAAGDTSAGMPMTLDLGAEVSSDIGLMQIRALVMATFQQLERCLNQGLMKQANHYRREWQTLVGTLRQWEKDIVKIQEGKGEVLRTRVINTELVRILTVIRQSFTNEMLALVETLKPEMPPAERRELVLRRRDKCFVHLKQTRFSSTYQPPNE